MIWKNTNITIEPCHFDISFITVYRENVDNYSEDRYNRGCSYSFNLVCVIVYFYFSNKHSWYVFNY